MTPTSPRWTRTSLTTLMHALALSPSDASTLLPYTPTQISNILRTISISLNNPPGWTAQRHSRAVLKRATGLSPPPRIRRKKSPPAPRHRISLQLIPATPRDDAAVRAVGAYPFVEIVLKAARRVWDVTHHLYSKWGLPVRVEHNRKLVNVDSQVVQLVGKGSRTVRLPYRVVNVDIDWQVLRSALEESAVTTPGKRRVHAPRDDDAFWTGQFDAIPSRVSRDNSVDRHDHDVCTFAGQKSGGISGAEAVMTRLRGHLEKLDQPCEDGGDGGDGKGGEGGNTTDRDIGAEEDPAIIPERFLRSCSRFEFAPSLPDSLLSLGKSDGSGDGNGVRNLQNGPVRDSSNVKTDAGANALQLMNDALDLRHELDLRCDEQLDGVDFLHPLADVQAPSLSLSGLFRE